MIENYGLYALKVLFERDTDWEGWVYEIYDHKYPDLGALRESNKWYKTAGIARLAAIEHIKSMGGERS